MFYLLIILLQMKLITKITDLNKAVNIEKNLGYVPTMGSLHKGHEFLIKKSKKHCKKTLVSIFVNPSQFNNKSDFKNYPRDLTKDIKILRKLNVDIVYLPSVNQIYKDDTFPKVLLKKTEKILCAKFRKGHFEGVLDVLNRFIKLISPKMIFMGEKDYQQLFLVKKFISKKYSTIVYPCKTIRSTNGVAISSRNKLLNKAQFKTSGLIANRLMKLKISIYRKNSIHSISNKKSKELIHKTKKSLTKKYGIKIEYLECRNLINLSTNLKNKPFKLFISYFLNNIRLIDNF